MPLPHRLASTALALALVSVPVAAQQPVGRAVSVVGGASFFDASGTGTAPMGAIRVEHPLVGRWMLGELGAGYARLDEQFRTSPTHLGILEAQVQVQAPFAHFRPYVGAGIGGVTRMSNRGERKFAEESASVAVGARIPLTGAVGFRGEMRVRGWKLYDFGFVNAAAETTFGLSVAF